jgi:hypothetical protein
MTARLVATALPYVIVAMLLLALVLFVLALQQLRRGRTGPYWRLRRQAGQRGGQLFLISVALFGVAFALAFFSGLADLALNGLNSALSRNPDGLRGVVIPTLTDLVLLPTQDATDTPDVRATTQAARSAATTLTALRPSDTPLPSETAVPSETPLPTGTPMPTHTPTTTLTPTPTFESVLQLTPPVSDQEPPRGAAIELMAAASGVASDNAPVEPGAEFAAGIERIYFFVRFENMENGVTWTRVLLREGVPIQGQSYRWSLGQSGESYFFFGDASGYPPGNYEARIFISADEASRLGFVVAGL